MANSNTNFIKGEQFYPSDSIQFGKRKFTGLYLKYRQVNSKS